MFGQRGQIVGVMIHIMSVSGLGGTPMSAAVVRYDAITMLEKEQHVGVPIISRQRPAVAKHDGLPFAPILVIDLCSVFGGDGCHGNAPSILVSDFLCCTCRDSSELCTRDFDCFLSLERAAILPCLEPPLMPRVDSRTTSSGSTVICLRNGSKPLSWFSTHCAAILPIFDVGWPMVVRIPMVRVRRLRSDRAVELRCCASSFRPTGSRGDFFFLRQKIPDRACSRILR